MAEPKVIDRRKLVPRLEQAFDFAIGQVHATIEREPDFFPIYTIEGRWKHAGESWTDWCGGFHAGMMWLIAERTGDPRWYQMAEHYSRLLEPRQHDRQVHDLGFIFLHTYLPWFRLSRDASVEQVLITAGRTLALRFNPRGGYLRSFVAPESLFIDIMMNVPLIFYTARATGDQALFDLAVDHCRTTERTLVRADGSTAHEALFDLETGAFLRQATHQGLRSDSTWARGLAWSLYGFGSVYRFTGNPHDLSVAQRNADYFLARSSATLVPPWDFDVPSGPDRIDDSSAAAIAASGLWNLAEHTEPSDAHRANRYRNAALGILDSLCSDHYLAWSTPGWEGVVKHGVYHYHEQLGVDESVMWGDFFFVEAVDKVLRGTITRSSTMHPDRYSEDEPGEKVAGPPRSSSVDEFLFDRDKLRMIEGEDDDDDEEAEEEEEALSEAIEEEPRTVLITGASGNIGRKLRAAWADVYDLVLIDRNPLEDDDEVIQADLGVLDDDWITHFHGVDTVVHLAANTDEFAAWDELIGPNLDALANVFHVAALAGVERIVFASSNHIMGMYENLGDAPIGTDTKPIPDGPYAVTKLVGERFGRSLARAFDVSFIALRLGWIQEGANRPETLPHDWARKMWLSNADLIRLFDCAVEAEIEDRSFVLVNGMSRNRGMRWDLSDAAELLGFLPVDDAFSESHRSVH